MVSISKGVRVYVKEHKRAFSFPDATGYETETGWVHVWSNKPSESNPYKSSSVPADTRLASFVSGMVIGVLTGIESEDDE